MSIPKNFVLVAGSFHSAWCWFKLQPLLSKNGNTCLAVDLPAHHFDATPAKDITLDSYVNHVCNEIEKINGPVILVGHSRAGIIISQVAEKIPAKIEQLVYLCAFLIPNGEPMVATALTDKESALVANLEFNEAEGWHRVKPTGLKECFYHDCNDEDTWLCQQLVTKEPNAPIGTPLQLSNEKYGRVKKVYIFTTEDRAITYPLQQKMVGRIPVDKTFTLTASHSPFLSQPKEIADILLHKI